MMTSTKMEDDQNNNNKMEDDLNQNTNGRQTEKNELEEDLKKNGRPFKKKNERRPPKR
jgi:hypothetical protein